jgi:predicted O-methyltransferase YrrM
MLSTTESEKNALRRAVVAMARPRVLEIGAFRGETTRALAEAAAERGGRVEVIDPMRWAAELHANGLARHLPSSFAHLSERITALLGDASYEAEFWQHVGAFRAHVRLHRALSSDPDLIASDDVDLAELDVVFVDGDHSAEGAAADLAQWATRTAVGGTIFVHDVTPRFPGVMQAVEAFADEHGLSMTRPAGDSLVAMAVTHPLDGTGRPSNDAWAPAA